MNRMLWILLLAWLSSAATAAPSIALLDDQPRTFELGAGYSTDYFFDVPAGVGQFRVELAGIQTSNDLDLLIRFGKPFPDGISDFFDLLEYAHYHAISGLSTEALIVSPVSARPPTAGRWYIVAVNGGTTLANARLTVDFQTVSNTPAPITVLFERPCPSGFARCQCDASFWNSTAPGPAAPGNPGTTLGDKRRNAFLEAVRILSTQLSSEVPIVVQACWSNLGGEANNATLAGAAPTFHLLNDPTLPDTDETPPQVLSLKQLPEPHTFYSAAAATRLSGTSNCRLVGGTCGNDPSIFIHFNTEVDGPTVLGERGFYYGLAPGEGADSDFVTVALHELTHGLGFGGLVDIEPGSVGEKPLNRDDIYSRQISDSSVVPAQSFTAITDAQRAAALTSSIHLQWTAPFTLANAVVPKLATDIGYRLWAPPVIEQGSTLSHVSRVFDNELMEPSLSGTIRGLGLASPMLKSVGWDTVPRSMPATRQIYTGLWFDPNRPGHGVDFQPVEGGPFDQAVALFYTYDDSGRPEYYIATGSMVDGVFKPIANASGDTLVRYVLVNGRPQVDSSTRGFMRIDFNDPVRTAACQRPGESGGTADTRAAMSVVINGQDSTWCLRPLIGASERESNDRTGIWVNGGSDDPGWGLSLAPLKRGDGSTALFGILYYHDGAGQPRWAFVQTENYTAPMTLALNNITGYCRTCTDNGRPFTPVGQLPLDLKAPVVGNTAGVTISFPGTPTVTFQRPTSPLSRLTSPPRTLNSQ